MRALPIIWKRTRTSALAQLVPQVVEIDMVIQEERKFAIDAAIVRTMKASRTCKIATLIPDVCKQLSFLFQAHPPFVRKRMEELIDKGFMERGDDLRELRYIA